MFSFRFITIFTSLYYYAFFTSDHEGAYVRISVTVFSLITVGQWWGALIDICMPSVVYRAMMYKMKVKKKNETHFLFVMRFRCYLQHPLIFEYCKIWSLLYLFGMSPSIFPSLSLSLSLSLYLSIYLFLSLILSLFLFLSLSLYLSILSSLLYSLSLI